MHVVPAWHSVNTIAFYNAIHNGDGYVHKMLLHALLSTPLSETSYLQRWGMPTWYRRKGLGLDQST
jgi:hypothetical protein